MRSELEEQSRLLNKKKFRELFQNVRVNRNALHSIYKCTKVSLTLKTDVKLLNPSTGITAVLQKGTSIRFELFSHSFLSSNYVLAKHHIYYVYLNNHDDCTMTWCDKTHNYLELTANSIEEAALLVVGTVLQRAANLDMSDKYTCEDIDEANAHYAYKGIVLQEGSCV